MINSIELFGVPIYRLEIEAENVEGFKGICKDLYSHKKVDVEGVIRKFCQKRLATTKGLFVPEDLFEHFLYEVNSTKRVKADIGSGHNPSVLISAIDVLPTSAILSVNDGKMTYSLKDVSQEYGQEQLSVFRNRI